MIQLCHKIEVKLMEPLTTISVRKVVFKILETCRSSERPHSIKYIDSHYINATSLDEKQL